MRVVLQRVRRASVTVDGDEVAVERGVFGANMDVDLLNDGPFTLVLDAGL